MRLGSLSLAMARPGACGECRVASFSTAVGGAAALGAAGAQGNYLEPGIPESSRLATWPKRGEDFYIQRLALALSRTCCNPHATSRNDQNLAAH